MNKEIQTLLDGVAAIFETTDNCLAEWRGEGNLQFPTLLGMVASKMNWNDKEVKKNEPFVRHFVWKHPDWHMRAGARGGIARMADYAKKQETVKTMAALKAAMKIEIEAKSKVAPIGIGTETVGCTDLVNSFLVSNNESELESLEDLESEETDLEV